MKENSIEEDIKIVEQIKDIFLHLKFHGWINDIKRDIDTDKAIKAIDRILSDYKRVLKENEELKNKKYIMTISCDGKCQICEHYENETIFKNRIQELEKINEEHQELNGELRSKLNEAKDIIIKFLEN